MNIICILSPQRIILGGSVLKQPTLLPIIRKETSSCARFRCSLCVANYRSVLWLAGEPGRRCRGLSQDQLAIPVRRGGFAARAVGLTKCTPKPAAALARQSSDDLISAYRWCREDLVADRARSAPVPIRPPRGRSRSEPRPQRARRAGYASSSLPRDGPIWSHAWCSTV